MKAQGPGFVTTGNEGSNNEKLITDDKVTGSNVVGADALPCDNVSHMIQTRDTAGETFKELNKHCEMNLKAGRFGDSGEAAAAREAVEESFNYFVTAHAKVVAAIGGGWWEIAGDKPVTMRHEEALELKKAAIEEARAAARKATEKAAAEKARIATEKAVVEARAAAEKARIAAVKVATENSAAKKARFAAEKEAAKAAAAEGARIAAARIAAENATAERARIATENAAAERARAAAEGNTNAAARKVLFVAEKKPSLAHEKAAAERAKRTSIEWAEVMRPEPFGVDGV